MTSSSFISLQRKEYFSKLIHLPEGEHKRLMIDSKYYHSSNDLVPNKTTLSTKSRCVMAKVEESLIPFVLPFLLASPIKRPRPSTTRRKSRGDNGQPCLKTWDTLKKLDDNPLISTEKFVDVTHPINQFIVSTANPTLSKMRRKNVQFTMSKAFRGPF